MRDCDDLNFELDMERPAIQHNVVMESENNMRIGPYRGYYGRAFWSDVHQRFEGWIICPDRVHFHSVKEKNIGLNFQDAVDCYLSEEEIDEPERFAI